MNNNNNNNNNNNKKDNKSNKSIVYDEICQRLSKEEIEQCLDMKMTADFEDTIAALGEGPAPGVKWKNTSALERQNVMNSFVMRIGSTDGDIRPQVLDQVCVRYIFFVTIIDVQRIWSKRTIFMVKM